MLRGTPLTGTGRHSEIKNQLCDMLMIGKIISGLSMYMNSMRTYTNNR